MDRRFAPLIALTLLATAFAAPPASAQENDPDYAAEWQDLKSHLGNGNVDQAESIYNRVFRGPADEAPVAKQAVEDGLTDARQAGSTQDLGYVAAKQQIDKAHYAIAYANVEKTVQAGDADAARAWFGLLDAKFGSDVANAQAAFENASSSSELDAAFATLTEEYRDVSTRKVYKETRETPGLLAGGDQATAVKEAAEARYYYLGIQAHVAEVLGGDAESKLTGELDELLQAALDGDQQTVDHEAEEILDLAAHYALATAPQEKADAFATLKNHLGDGNVSQARTVYQDAFGDAADEYAPDAHARIRTALDDAEAAASAGDDAEYDVQAQIIKKGILDVAHTVAFHELAESEIHEGLEYFAVLSAKFGWTDRPTEAALHVGHIAASDKVTDEHRQAAETGVAETFLDKVREEVEEVFIHWDDNPKAREKAIEGVVYFHPASGYVADLLGPAVADEMLAELEELYNHTTAGDRQAADEAAGEVRKLLDQVDAGSAEVTELDSLVNDLKGKIDFVLEEYRGYFEAKEAGDEDEAQTELGEAKAFTQAARTKILDNEAALRDADSQAVDTILTDLDEIERTLENLGPLDDVETRVQDALALLEKVKRSDVEGTVTIVFGPAQAGDAPGTLVAPITLEGVPEDGFGFQAKVTYDTSVVTVTDVEVVPQVGFQTISNGSFTFNTATTSASGGTAEVARVTFTVEDPDATSAGLDVEVQDLADAQGNPLGVKSIDTSGLDLSAAETGRTLPGPGTLLSVLALAGAALAVIRD